MVEAVAISERLSSRRDHQTLRVTPAMEAGLTDHVWNMDEWIGLLPELQAKKRGPYKKREKFQTDPLPDFVIS